MTNARLDGLRLLLLGSLTFIVLGAAFENASQVPLIDFKGLYYPTQCLIHHCDPYKQSDVQNIYQSAGIEHSLDAATVREIATKQVYPPSTFSFILPFAMLPWGPARIVWMTLTVASLIFAAFLLWKFGESYDSVISGALIGLLLANSELAIITGNPATIAISFCIVAVWCFLRERFVSLGILCFAISLAVKPHDTGLVWLYFLLAGGVYRKRAIQTLIATAVFCLPSVIWVWHLAPDWIQELQSTISGYAAHGGLSDPGPASTGGHSLGMIVDLQVIFSFFRDDPRFYNPASYVISGLLILVWVLITLRSRPTPERTWLALASISALTLLPFYHRQLDTMLLLLTVPACAMLCAKNGWIGRLALLVTTAAFVLTGFLSWAIFLGFLGNLHLPATRSANQILIAVQALPTPLILLLTGVFYLWVYARHCSTEDLRPGLL